MQVLMRARGRSGVSLRDVTIAQMGNGASKCEWRHAPEALRGFGEFWRKLVKLRTGRRTRRVDFCLLVEALGRCRTRWGGGRWKSQYRKNVYHSPYVEEPLNSKVIKSFVPEIRSRKCFSCFEIPMFYVYVHFAYSCMAMVHWDQAESTREPINYGRFIYKFPLDTIKSIQPL